MSFSESNDNILERIPAKATHNMRLVTFNINGFRTLFHYHPWNKLRTLNAMFDSLKADIITLQELKVTTKDIDNSLGTIDGYSSFLTIPSIKKGYSGVAVYVRIPKTNEPTCIQDALRVIKAEEGLTGVLISHDSKIPYVNSDQSIGIGGYVDGLDPELAKKVDSEGRCIVLEMANGVVIISTYCPANSMGTDEGQEFRESFFKALFGRIRNLEKMGKQVVLMGDINISRDLIDSAESLDTLFKSRLIKEASEEEFDKVNYNQCMEFIKSSIPKMMLNKLLIDSIWTDEEDEKRIFVDTVRKIQGRKRALYTVWNTIMNSRPGNYGSRIDLILATPDIAKTCQDANILPFLMGSDHCPVYSDFDVSSLKSDIAPQRSMPRLEAKYVYKLSTGDIGMMFAMAKKRSASSSPAPSTTSKGEPHTKVQKTETLKRAAKPSSRGTNSISNFFKMNKTTANEEEPIPFNLLEDVDPTKIVNGPKITVSNGKLILPLERVPICTHKEPCILKTSSKPESKGKKFWTCAKDRGNISNNKDKSSFSCGFFQWK